MDFFLHSFDRKFVVPIGEDCFEVTVAAHDELSKYEAIEALFDLLARSYLEFEKLLINLAFDYAYHRDYEFIFSEKSEESVARANIAISSFLSTANSYIEQTKSLLNSINVELMSDYEVTFREIYDSSFEYRIMQQLRNIFVHGSAVLVQVGFGHTHQLQEERNWQGPMRSRIVASPRIEIREISENRKTKATLRKELEALSASSTHLDLCYLTRQYVRMLFEGHRRMRRSTKVRFERACQKILNVADLATSSGLEKSESLFLARKEDTQRFEREVDARFVKRIEQKRYGWATLENTNFKFVSNELHMSSGTYFPAGSGIYIPR